MSLSSVLPSPWLLCFRDDSQAVLMNKWWERNERKVFPSSHLSFHWPPFLPFAFQGNPGFPSALEVTWSGLEPFLSFSCAASIPKCQDSKSCVPRNHGKNTQTFSLTLLPNLSSSPLLHFLYSQYSHCPLKGASLLSRKHKDKNSHH